MNNNETGNTHTHAHSIAYHFGDSVETATLLIVNEWGSFNTATYGTNETVPLQLSSK